MSATTVDLTIICPDWCQSTPEKHVADLWEQDGDCLHVAWRDVVDRTGHKGPLREPRFHEPVEVEFVTCQRPDGPETVSPVVILNEVELSVQQAADLADALRDLVAQYRAGGGIE